MCHKSRVNDNRHIRSCISSSSLLKTKPRTPCLNVSYRLNKHANTTTSSISYYYIPVPSTMSSRKKRSGKSNNNRLETIPEQEPVAIDLPIREREAPRHDYYDTGFVDVPAALEALIERPPYPPSMERPPSRKGLVSGDRPPSRRGMDRQVESSRKAKATSKDKPLPPPPEDPQQESSTAPNVARAWPQAFSGTPRAQSNQRPMPFVGRGQATYIGRTEFDVEITFTIIWNANNVWGQFTIDKGFGAGYIRTTVKPRGRPAENRKPVIFHWHGLGGNKGEIVPASKNSDCTKSEFKILKNGEEIWGSMRPMDHGGRLNWTRSSDGNDYLLAQHFEFSGVRAAKSEVDEDQAWNGWNQF